MHALLILFTKILGFLNPDSVGGSPHQKIRSFCPAKPEIDLISREGSQESGDNNPGEFEITPMCQKTGDHQNGFTLKESSHQKCWIPISGN